MTLSNSARAHRTVTSDEEMELNRYDRLKFDDIKDNYQSLIFETEPGTSNERETTQNLRETSSEEKLIQPKDNDILSEVEGVIDRLEEKTVRVKLYPKTYANFPYILFTNSEKIRQGQHIKYFIKKAKDGYRYQEIVPIDNLQQHPEKKEILRILDEFKYRDV